MSDYSKMPTLFETCTTVRDEMTFKFKFNEKVIERMKKLYSIDYEKFVDTVWDKYDEKKERTLNREKWYNDPQTYYERFKKWLEKFIMPTSKLAKEKYSIEKYKYARNKKGGRIYVRGFGFQSLHGKIRNYLFYDCSEYYDLDMENCHFKLLRYFCRQSELINDDDYKLINEYCDNRKTCLEKWNCDKFDVLRMLNKDQYGIKENEHLQVFHKEISKIKDILINEYKHICCDTTNKWNPKSSRLDFLLCYAENKVLQYVMEHEKNACCPFFDGYIANTKPNIDDVNELTQQWGVTWSIKPFENTMKNIEDNVNMAVYDAIGSDKFTNALNFFEFLEEASHSDFAQKYVDMEKNIKYTYCVNGKIKMWFEWNDYNIIKIRFSDPDLLSHKITKFFSQVLKMHYMECVANMDANSQQFLNISYISLLN